MPTAWLLLSAGWPPSRQPDGPGKAHGPMTRAREIHEAALVLDAHTDTLRRVVMDGVDLAERSAGDPLAERADLPRDRDGSVNAQIFAAWVDTIYLPDHAARCRPRALGTRRRPDRMALGADR